MGIYLILYFEQAERKRKIEDYMSINSKTTVQVIYLYGCFSLQIHIDVIHT